LLALLAMSAGRPPRLSGRTHSALRTPHSALSVSYARLPLSFEANEGQTDGQVKFVSRGSGYTLFLTATETVLQLRNADNARNPHSALRTPQWRNPQSEIPNPKLVGLQPTAHSPQPAVLRLRLLGANPNSEVRGLEELPGKSNYSIGSDPSKWRTNIPNYAEVEYRDVYPGINLVHYGNQRQLEYDFVVSPGADPRQIKFEVEGAERTEIDETGDLVMHVPGGGASLSPATGLTGANGQAQTVVTLGTTPGAVGITASVTGVSPAVFTLTAVPGPPASLSIVLGDNQAAVAGTTLPTPLIVKLTDVHGNGVSGATVNFEVTWGGGSLSAATATTGANGQAQVIWTLGSVPGSNSARAWMGTLGPVVFQATGLSGGVPVGSITVENATGSPGGTARIAVTLNLNSGSSVDSLSFGIGVTPNGAAPELTDPLSFVADTGMGTPSLIDPWGTGPISVSWLSLPAALSGTVRLGEVVVSIPALATEGQTYRVRVTGASVTLGSIAMAVLAGANRTLTVVGHSYLVGDAFPLGSDLNGDGDKDDASEFGDGSLEMLDLVYALRAVTSVPGYRPPACSDRFDAIDSHPADTPTVRGGNATLNTVDLIYTLRRVTNVDPSRPRRDSRNLPCTAGAGPELVAQAMPSGEPAARLELGLPQAAEGGAVRVPVYLEAARALELAGLSFSIGMTGLQPETWNLEPGTAPPPTLVDPDVPGVLSIAWLEGLQVAAGQRLLLGYVAAPGLEPGTDGLRFVGISANAPDGSDVPVGPPALREQM
jgi:hypothetical protein